MPVLAGAALGVIGATPCSKCVARDNFTSAKTAWTKLKHRHRLESNSFSGIANTQFVKECLCL